MAKFRTGVDNIKNDAKKKSGRKFTTNIYWKPEEVRTVAWVTAADEIPKVRVHQMVNFPDDRFPSGIRYETFVCKKDPALVEESGGACELCDRVGHEAVERYVALAIELEPVKEGKRVTSLRVKEDTYKDRDGNDASSPRWGIVIQASKNFFSYFVAYEEASGDIRDVAWEIHRDGGGSDTKYHPFVVMNGPSAVSLPDLSSVIDTIPPLEELLEEMATVEKYAQVAELEAGSQPSFGAAPKKPTSAAPVSDRESEFAKMRSEVLASAVPEGEEVLSEY